MTTAPTTAERQTAIAAGEHLAYGAVHLDVIDVERSLAFWRDLIGLEELASEPGAAHLGAGGRTLLVLHGGAVRPAPRGRTGLYHVAIHLPDAREFARVLARLMVARIPQSPTDHIFSKATYLRDPDGLMLELTLETPERFGSLEVGGGSVIVRDSDGNLRGATEALDVDAALAALDDGEIAGPLPDGTFVGHVHLHVRDIAEAYAFYRDVVGFTGHALMTPIGMADLGAGGVFPHRIAVNEWHGPAAPAPEPGTAGLRLVELVVPDEAALAALAARAGEPVADGVVRLHDPAGTPLAVTVALPST